MLLENKDSQVDSFFEDETIIWFAGFGSIIGINGLILKATCSSIILLGSEQSTQHCEFLNLLKMPCIWCKMIAEQEL